MDRQYSTRATRRRSARRRHSLSLPAAALVTLGLLAIFAAVVLPTVGAIEVATSDAFVPGAPLVTPAAVARSVSLLAVGVAALLLGTTLSLARMA